MNTSPDELSMSQALEIWREVLIQEAGRPQPVDIQKLLTDRPYGLTLTMTASCSDCWEHPQGVRAVTRIAATYGPDYQDNMINDLILRALFRYWELDHEQQESRDLCLSNLAWLIKTFNQQNWTPNPQNFTQRQEPLLKVAINPLLNRANPDPNSDEGRTLVDRAIHLLETLRQVGVNLNAPVEYRAFQNVPLKFTNILDCACAHHDGQDRAELAITALVEAGVEFSPLLEGMGPGKSFLRQIPLVRRHTLHDLADPTAKARRGRPHAL